MKVMIKAHQDHFGNVIFRVANPSFRRQIADHLWNCGFKREYEPSFLQPEAAVQEFESHINFQAWRDISAGYTVCCYIDSDYLEQLIGYDFVLTR